MSTALTFDFARPWRTHPRETAGLGLLGLAAAIALAGAASSTSLSRWPGRSDSSRDGRRPCRRCPTSTRVRPVAPEDALQINSRDALRHRPESGRPARSLRRRQHRNPRARARVPDQRHLLRGRPGKPRRPARASPRSSSTASATRPSRPASAASSIEGSTRATGCQFTFTCDGSLARAPERSRWNRARAVAEAALAGFVYTPVGNATHYHANYVVPYWASTLAKNAVVGAHIFYRWSGGWGPPGAFAQAYSRPRAERRRRCALRRRRACRTPARGAEALAPAIDEDGRRPGRCRRMTAKARRGPVQPDSAQGGRRGEARRLCRAVSRRRTICAGR